MKDPLKMRIQLVLTCDDRFAAKARYVLLTFCKTLGLDAVEVASGAHTAAPDVPTVWYGPTSDMPAATPGLIGIGASPEAPAFFAARNPRRAGELIFASRNGRRIPFLFAPPLEAGLAPANPSEPLFARRSEAAYLPYDLVASAFYFLSCWEETVVTDRDPHGRFLYRRSLAAQLDLPENIVDLYLDLFIALLNFAGDGRWPRVEIPTWEGNALFVVCLTHDVDTIRKSRLSRLKFLGSHLVRPANSHRRTPLSDRARFALSTLLDRRDPVWTFPAFADLERQFNFTASYFFRAASAGRNGRAGYSLSERRVHEFIDDLLAGGFEIGLHGSYHSAFDEGRFLEEKAALAALLKHAPTGHRQHYLRMKYATTLPIYEHAALDYDMTLSYAEHEGYRNQFSYPYRPFNHEADRPHTFWELPTVIMDVTLGGYRALPADLAWRVIEKWLEDTCVRRGCLTLLWHNVWDGEYPGYFDLCPRILAWIDGHGGRGLAGRDVLQQWLAR